MINRNIDIHGANATPSQLISRIKGLTGRYLINKQMLSWWKTYIEVTNLLYREYDQTRVYPEITKTFIEGRALARAQIVLLQEAQRGIQAEIDRLNGQLPLPEVDDNV